MADTSPAASKSPDKKLFVELPSPERVHYEFRLNAISPDDGKYECKDLKNALSAKAEWMTFVKIQRALLATRVEFGLAPDEILQRLDRALPKIDPVNIALLEERVTKHDQLAVLAEIERVAGSDVAAYLHPGTTSYDIVDTARSYLFRQAWRTIIAPEVATCINKLCELSDRYKDTLQAGRTHLQGTSPVPFGATLAAQAAELSNRFVICDQAFKGLKGKVSGIVGTGASVDIVIGEGRSLEFEKRVLAQFGLEPDLTATQIVQKAPLCDAGHALVNLMNVLAKFANDMRILYSTEIAEVTSMDAKARLRGSSADAGKNNPINWENIKGKLVVVQAAMPVLYAQTQTDLHRDLAGSVQARYQPQGMMSEILESFRRANKELDQLTVNDEAMAHNLRRVRDFPSEALTAILRHHSYQHPELGLGHEVVGAFSRRAKSERRKLIEVALEDEHFAGIFRSAFSEREQRILNGELELYLGSAEERRVHNIAACKERLVAVLGGHT